MELTHIISLVPQNEHFDASAVNEGVWLSINHLQAVEGALANNRTEALTQELTTVQEQLNAANTTIQGFQVDIAAKDATINKHLNKISELEVRINELGGQSSGTGSNVNATVDPPAGGAAADGIRFDSDNHPANILADRKVGKSNRDDVFNMK